MESSVSLHSMPIPVINRAWVDVNPLPKIGRLPNVILGIISSYNAIPKNLTYPLPYPGYNRGFVSNAHVRMLDQAHANIEQLYLVFTISKLSKSLYAEFGIHRTNLISSVVKGMSELHDSDRGAKCLRECVDSGWYLKVMRVFFFYKPAALWNYAMDPIREEGFKRTILHSACAPNCWNISLPFVAFVIEMDKTHRLALATHKDCKEYTPLARTRDTRQHLENNPNFLDTLAANVQIEQMLIRHVPPSRNLRAPRVPAQALPQAQAQNRPPVASDSSPVPAVNAAPPAEAQNQAIQFPNRGAAIANSPTPPLSEAPRPQPQPLPPPPPLRWYQKALNAVSSFFSFIGNKICSFFSYLWSCL